MVRTRSQAHKERANDSANSSLFVNSPNCEYSISNRCGRGLARRARFSLYIGENHDPYAYSSTKPHLSCHRRRQMRCARSRVCVSEVNGIRLGVCSCTLQSMIQCCSSFLTRPPEIQNCGIPWYICTTQQLPPLCSSCGTFLERRNL